MAALEWFEVSELPSLGWFRITDIGEENVYIELADGRRGFFKP